MISIVEYVPFGPIAIRLGGKEVMRFSSEPSLFVNTTVMGYFIPNVWIALHFGNTIRVPFAGVFRDFAPSKRLRNVSAMIVVVFFTIV
jgi:hypothetical protein